MWSCKPLLWSMLISMVSWSPKPNSTYEGPYLINAESRAAELGFAVMDW